MNRKLLFAMGALSSVVAASQPAWAAKPVADCQGALQACNQTCAINPDGVGNSAGSYEKAIQGQVACRSDCQNAFNSCTANHVNAPPPPPPPAPCVGAACGAKAVSGTALPVAK